LRARIPIQEEEGGSFVFCEKLLGYCCDKDFAKVLLMVLPGLAELWIVRGSLCWLLWKSQKCTEMPKFGGGSDRNRALLGNPVQPVHDMQIVQRRINTGYFASC
jgi:hypothetical protein